uniref:Chitin-binding type-2 domain-containing protein n=1 Tax=Bactrocera dorsalis TaxID=27457 RepID=A0A034WPA5_BACDO
MKSRLLLVLCLWLLIAAACAAEDTCDPDSDGKPVCPANSNGQTYRNFWDPTRYWVCNGAGEPTSESCPDNTGYSGTTNKCIPWTDWVWVPPCGSNEALLNINLSA